MLPLDCRFMGLLDTVGALGVPRITPGVGLTYEFYDQNVSWEVQTVCQALATHDRLKVFTPCFVRRSRVDKNNHYSDTEFDTEEVWFPGASMQQCLLNAHTEFQAPYRGL